MSIGFETWSLTSGPCGGGPAIDVLSQTLAHSIFHLIKGPCSSLGPYSSAVNHSEPTF